MHAVDVESQIALHIFYVGRFVVNGCGGAALFGGTNGAMPSVGGRRAAVDTSSMLSGANRANSKASSNFAGSLNDRAYSLLDAGDIRNAWLTQKSHGNFFDFIAHGDANNVYMGSNRSRSVSAVEAAEMIKNAPGYTPGQGVRLLACETGAAPNGFARQLATELQATVIAPVDLLQPLPNGDVIVRRHISGNDYARSFFRRFSDY
jgi:hypothetical protein